MLKSVPLIVNGWNIFAHSLFLDQVEALINQVQTLRKKDPTNYRKKNATKRLAAIAKLAFTIIPQDPTLAKYRQGGTLGDSHKHWLRAKFFQQYRLFFRFHQKSHIIVYAWVNDAATKRAYNSKLDAYYVFNKMLENGRPPTDWQDLLKQAQTENKRLSNMVSVI